MYRKLFQELTINEMEQYVTELESAVENHSRWLAGVNRTLICKLPPEAADLSETPHQFCQFGRWYHGIDNPYLSGIESFRRIGHVHERMHMVAKRLMQKQQTITTEEYDELVALTDELRTLANALRHDLNQNRNLVSKLMSKVFQNASEGVVITAPDSTIISVNRAFSEVTGYSAEEAIGQTPALLQSGRQSKDFYRRMWSELERFGQWQGEIWNRKKSGEDYLEWLSIAAVKDENGTLSHYVAIFSDITTAKDNEERLQYLAHYDQLTKLPNRILFNDRMQQAIANARRNEQKVAIMFLDLDGFKAVNDSLGHNAGDELLLQVAQRLTNCLRATDTVARFGGDEFTIVLPNIDDETSVIQVAQKIGREVAEPYTLDGHEASITTSIGISIYPDDGTDAQQLVEYADNAMYHAKRHGKNHHEFYAQLC